MMEKENEKIKKEKGVKEKEIKETEEAFKYWFKK